ncbi:hypothetical protein FS837_003248 [Tulasnella sp. UAMH 9824]|nr:hypothetical protein FS837_003248 [Tulasnella sp. UAMH 9824]
MALFARPPQPPHQHLGLDNIIDDGAIFAQLTHALSKYEQPLQNASIHLGASSTSGGIVSSLRVNKQLPPLPLEDESDEVHTPLHGQATEVDCPPSNTTSLSIYPPPSPKSRNSGSSGAETCTSILDTNFGTSTTNSFADFPSRAAFTPSPPDSPSIEKAAQLPAQPVDQSWSDPEAELAKSTTRASSPTLQIAAHDYTLLEEGHHAGPSSPVQTSLLTNWNWDSSGPERSLGMERKPHGPRQTWFVPNRDFDSSGFGRSHVMEDEPIVATLPTIRSSKSYPRRKRSLSGKPMPSVAPQPRQFQVPPYPNYPHQFTTTKRKRAEGHSQPPSPDQTSFSHVSVDHIKKRSRYHHQQLSRSSSLSSSGGKSSSSSSQPIYDSSTPSAQNSAVGWVYTLPLTLEELFNGGTYYYRITTRLLSGEPKVQEVRVDIKPGWKAGTRIIFPDAGNERYPGVFQTMVFVVKQVDHKKFTRREGRNLECHQDMYPLEASMENGRRALRKVVGLDGKVIEFYPPKGVIYHGQEMIIEGEGMPRRSKGQVVGRGDLVIRWNIKAPDHIAPNQVHRMQGIDK